MRAAPIWNHLDEQIAKIEVVVTTFEVLSPQFSGGKVFFRVTALGTLYVATPNVAVKNPADQTPDWISGLGDSIEEALVDGIQVFFQAIEKHEAHGEKDFEWSSFNNF